MSSSKALPRLRELYYRVLQYVSYRTIFSPSGTQFIVGVYFTALFRVLASSRTRLLDHTQRRVTVGRTPLNE